VLCINYEQKGKKIVVKHLRWDFISNTVNDNPLLVLKVYT